MLVVGLTGGIGSGKSTAADFLAQRGALVIDADEVARAVVEPGQPALDAIVERFGSGVLTEDGRLDRAALGALVFADDAARHDLEAITHPEIAAEMTRRIAEAPADAIVVCDVPLIAERDEGGDRYGFVVVVEAPPSARMARLAARGMSPQDVEARMAAQATDEERREMADVVLTNAGNRDDLERKVDALWFDLQSRNDVAP